MIWKIVWKIVWLCKFRGDKNGWDLKILYRDLESWKNGWKNWNGMEWFGGLKKSEKMKWNGMVVIVITHQVSYKFS